jgi:hypothetical protein
MTSTHTCSTPSLCSLLSALCSLLSQTEAKEAFRELLASIDCEASWTWEQAMKLIVNDPRYEDEWGV